MGAFDDLMPRQQATAFSDLIPGGAPPALPDGQRYANGVWDDLVAGYQQSIPGLVDRGRLPDVVLDPQHAKWYDKALAGLSQGANELPEALGAGFAGTLASGGNPVAGWAAGNAVPTAIRESLIQAYEKGEVKDAGDFLNRTAIVMKEAGKAGIVGALTGKAGAMVEGLGIVGQGAAEAGTMASVSAALDGRLPNAEDFANAAVMVVGMKGASLAAGKMAKVYERTGITPDQVAADAARDPKITDELKIGAPDEVPTAYEKAAAEQVARDVVPDPKEDEAHALNLAAMLSNPYGEIPKDKLPNYENFRYVQGPEDMQEVSARASEVFEQQIQEARGSQTWEQTKEKAIEFLAKRAADMGEEFVMPRGDDAVVGLAAKGMAAESMQQAASQALADAARKIATEGATPENIRGQIAAIEMIRAWTALDQGNGAEIARALNARKAAMQMRVIAEGVMEGLGKYGDDPEKLSQLILSLKDPRQVARLANQVEPATTWQKIQQYYRFSLLTGATVFQVKGIGDMMATVERLANAALRVPAAAVGSGEFAARSAELSAMVGSIGQGVKDGMRAMIDTWKALAEPRAVFGEPGKPNLADKITSFPGRIIESETELFRVLNERMEMSRQAVSVAMDRGFKPGTQDFDGAVTTLLQSPTKEMAKASELAGAEATFTNQLGKYGKLVQQFSKTPIGGFIVPFARVPLNISAWAIKDTPALGMLMEGNRTDWASGGAARDGVIARQIIGGAAAALAASAVAGGMLTGGGLSLTPQERAARRAAGIQDYSLKINGTWYSYERFEPLGAIAMLTADMMEMHHQADQAYKADIAKMTASVLGHAIVSQPYFEGIHQFMEAMTSPEKSARRFDGFVGSFVPSILAQAASSADPNKRRVDSLFDAVQQRIPIWREQLLPQINPLTGETVENPRGLGLVATSKESDDKVLTEAARLQVGTSNAPKAIEMMGKGPKDIRKVELTPEQQTTFSTKSGEFVHQLMTPIVNSPMWDTMPEMLKKQMFSKAMSEANKWGRMHVLTAEQRADEAERIHQALAVELEKR